MDQQVVDFIRALRARGVRISLAESIDAMRCVEVAGIADKQFFRSALRASLVKEPRDLPTFDELFPRFFGLDTPPPLHQPGSGMSPEEREQLERMLQQMLASLTPEQLRRLFEMMMTGQSISGGQMRQFLSENTTAMQMVTGFQPWATRRALRELHFDRLEQLLQELLERLRQAGISEAALQQLEQEARENRAALAQQIGKEVGNGLQQYEAEERRRRPIEDLQDRPFEELQHQNDDDMRAVINRLAAQLRTRVALRQKRASKGALDAKSTIRANLRYSGVPLDVRYRHKHLKPRITVICDVSGSMRAVTGFMLMLVYALQDQISRTRPFVYYRTLADVQADFQRLRPEEAIRVVPERVQGGPWQTNLSECLATFTRDHLDAVDRRTTVIFLGDGDDHLSPPNPRAFEIIKRRAHRVVWFNPEPPYRWGRDDNHMHIYGPMCDAVHHVSNLRQLVAAVDGLFQ
jgi:uncharacterized protein with von Willebrand factor type A (vWA) domain